MLKQLSRTLKQGRRLLKEMLAHSLMAWSSSICLEFNQTRSSFHSHWLKLKISLRKKKNGYCLLKLELHKTLATIIATFLSSLLQNTIHCLVSPSAASVPAPPLHQPERSAFKATSFLIKCLTCPLSHHAGVQVPQGSCHPGQARPHGQDLRRPGWDWQSIDMKCP